ncbi:MAG TPA: hypothetical protein PKY25_03045, partial [Bacilli bacterium]|nr:hypothetical protein [Bacilli bacterium]
MKLIFKRFWWVILVVIFIIVVLFIIIDNSGSKKRNDDKNSNNLVFKNYAMSTDLPKCPSDTSHIFTKPFMDGDYPDYIIPLGNSNSTSHTVPTDHVYPTNNTYKSEVPVYSPGTLTLIWVENKRIYNSKTNEFMGSDYQLNFAPCRGINFGIIHLTGLSKRLIKAIDETDPKCSEGEYKFNQDDVVYYKTCHPDFDKITLKPGELIGTFGNMPHTLQMGFDIGIYDFNKPDLKFISKKRYYAETVHTACPFDYFIDELRNKYLSKMGGVEQQKDSRKFIKRNKEPLCGEIMYDVEGTISGDWFKNKIDKTSTTNQEGAVALVHDNLNPKLAKLSINSSTSITFTPKHSGYINREFNEVTADKNIYCYQYDGNGSQGAKILIELIDDTHIKLEHKNGMCTNNEEFNEYTTYYR